tara:strand:- start:73 stop:1035 length:963 start_codon:yes stop_codon:yes gene_type:complete
MNFIVTEMTFMRYFMPLIAEGNKRSIKSKIFISSNPKYNNPYLFRKEFKKIKSEYGAEILDLSQVDDHPDKTFLIEGCGIDHLNYENEKYSLTYMTDFATNFDNYIDKVDNVIFPSEYLAQCYDKLTEKNLYLGSPKYDVEFDKNEILKKYDLDDSKKVLLIFPRTRDMDKIDLEKLYSDIRQMGYKIMVKTRGKDPINEDKLKGDYYFLDRSWYPHTTMELIEVSDFVINFGSTSIKECVLMRKPVVNFDIKPFKLLLDFLYDYPYCAQLGANYDFAQLQSAVTNLINNDHTAAFDEAIDKFLFEPGQVSKKILDEVMG